MTNRSDGVVAVGVFFLMAVSLGAAGKERRGHRLAEPPRAQAAPAPATPPDTVAVVPFSNISQQPSDDWIGDGIAETVRGDLQARGLSVLERAAVVAVREPVAGETVDEGASVRLGRQLGVRWVVSGGYQRVGDQLRITARFVDVASGAVLRTAKVDGRVDELFALQDRIVAELTTELDLNSAAPGLVRRLGGGAGGVLVAVPTPSGTWPKTEGGEPATSGLVPPSDPRDVTGDIVVGEPAHEPPGRDAARPGSEPAGVASGAGILTGRPSVRATRTSTPPRIDGRLDDALWRDAVRLTEFAQMRPRDGAPATEATEVYIAYDSTNIYFGFHAHYSDPGSLRANRADRDRAEWDDTFTVYLDTFLDQQRAYVFSVNGYGVQGDSIFNSRGFGGGGFGRGGGGFGAPRGDSSWDALFDSAGQLVEDGFTAEMAIPFKSLRYPQRGDGTPHRWGFQIARSIQDKDETDVWSPVSRSVAGFLPQMGVLEGMTNLSTSRNIEILPTFTAMQFGALDDASGAFVNDKADPEGGLNFKYGVTSNLTADLTFNPDFSQIESDRPQIAVNQRFDLFFPELRPFFLEGAEIFSIGGPVTMVHTRTIVDPLYGAKLTGKAGSTTIGVMYANDEAAGALAELDDPTLDRSAQTFVGRVRYDLYAESHIGVVFTDREFLDSYSRVGGLDSNFRLGDTHSVSFRAVGTRHRDLDGVDTTGYLIDASLRKRGRNLRYGISSYALSPDFKTDVGFVRRTDQRRTNSNISYRWWPETWLISWGPSARYGRSYTFDGVLEDEDRQIGINFSFANNLAFNTNVSRDVERFGGIDFEKTRYRLFGRMNSSRLFGFAVGYNFGDQIFYDPANPYLGRHSTIFSNISLRPIARLRSSININTSHFTDTRNNADDVVFDVKIFRALTTYQFTDRFLLRNITEYNTFDKTLKLSFLVTYRVNSGTVFYIGYDDRYQQGDLIDDEFFPTTGLQRTNRAFFMKFQYLFRY